MYCHPFSPRCLADILKTYYFQHIFIFNLCSTCRISSSTSFRPLDDANRKCLTRSQSFRCLTRPWGSRAVRVRGHSGGGIGVLQRVVESHHRQQRQQQYLPAVRPCRSSGRWLEGSEKDSKANRSLSNPFSANVNKSCTPAPKTVVNNIKLLLTATTKYQLLSTINPKKR